MTDLQDLLAAVRANPADDLPRLVLADWLEERDHDVTKWRQWIDIRRKCRDGWGKDGKSDIRVDEILQAVPHWLQRCYAADACRFVESLNLAWAKEHDAVENARVIAELYACDLANENDLYLPRSHATTNATGLVYSHANADESDYCICMSASEAVSKILFASNAAIYSARAIELRADPRIHVFVHEEACRVLNYYARHMALLARYANIPATA